MSDEAPADVTSALVPDLCLVGAGAEGLDTAEAALRALADRAVEQGYAHPTFVDAVLQREESFPTGLPLPVPVAIPHADAHHVRRPALAAVVPPRPLAFGEMGGSGRSVEVELVLMLLVVDPQAQVALLGRLIKALQAPDLRERLLDDLDDAEQLSRRFQALLDGA